MKVKINKYLKEIEEEKSIKILLACETGSRAWGFPSPDSDFDIRVIYLHQEDWYLGLGEKKDSFERMLENNDLDITGWDLRKSLRLLKKSNAPLLERIQSPIIYRADTQFVADILELSKQFYSKIATIYHYLSMAKKIFEEVKSGNEYKLKKLFYALRTAVACKWILESDQIPPIEFSRMISGLKIEKGLKSKIADLISLKSTYSEAYFHKGESEIFDFIETIIAEADQKASHLPAAKGNIKELDRFFIKTLKSKWT